MNLLCLWLCLAQAAPAKITVNPATVIAPVNRALLGTNELGYPYNPKAPQRVEYSNRGAGVWDPEHNQPVPEVLALAKAAGQTTLRWPGGCEAHLFRWKDTVGPLAERPHQQFGLHEFMRLCEALGAEPMITISEYYGTAQDAAELVEYLNAPVGAHRGAGRDWAALRAAMGHPAPFKVRWFEYGNESEHGDHHQQKYTPEEYANRYQEYRRTMREVDPSVQLGLVLSNTTWTPVGAWTETVLRRCPAADFVIHHAYLPGYSSNDAKQTPAEIFASAFAVDVQFKQHYRDLVATVQRLTGRRIPFCITEYNGAFVQERPYPYRLTHGNALVAGLILTALNDPELPIANAQYWQFANEYWGAVKGYGAPYVKRPAQLMFELFHKYLGDRQIAAPVDCAKVDVPGGWGVVKMAGARRDTEELGAPIALGPWQISASESVRQSVTADVLTAEITTAQDFNFYHNQRLGPAQPGEAYRLTAELRTTGLNPLRGAQLQIGDGRGYNATHSCALTPTVLAADWTPVQVDYQGLPDTTSLVVQARRLEGGGGRGVISVRKVQVRPVKLASPGAMPVLTVLATSRWDGTVLLLVFNKDLNQATDLSVTLPGATSGKAESLVGPTLEATNEQDPQKVKVVPTALTVADGEAKLSLPPFSLTGIVLRKGLPPVL